MTGRRMTPGGLRVATPCSADWDSMAGDERVRFCGRCDLHVYNISEMSADEASALIAGAEGRLCARFYRRPDGTVITKDCPVGLVAVRARVSRAAGLLFAAALSLLPGTVARAAGAALQGEARKPFVVKRAVDSDAREGAAILAGQLFDANGALISAVRVTLLNKLTRQKQTAATDEEGSFRFEGLKAGEYTLSFESPGFRSFETRISLRPGETVSVEVTLDVAIMGEIVTTN